jgi:adenosylhomocysteine nucleosidase
MEEEDMVCIGVIGAMEEEVASLINQMEDAESKTMAGMTFNKGKLWNQDAVVVQSGIGKVNMAICTQILVNIYGVDMLINTGVAGGLYKDINVGDIVISSDALQHDFECYSGNGDIRIYSRHRISGDGEGSM